MLALFINNKNFRFRYSVSIPFYSVCISYVLSSDVIKNFITQKMYYLFVCVKKLECITFRNTLNFSVIFYPVIYYH
jgi:hypothetical protein